MLHACAIRFDVMFWGENFLELNTPLQRYTRRTGGEETRKKNRVGERTGGNLQVVTTIQNKVPSE
jgi:hypothetical protein